MTEKFGKIDISHLKTPPEKHELETARYFAALGCDIEFIPPSNMPDVHTADIKMCGIEWEIKSPTGKSKRTIENNFRKALLQSKNIIFDLRKCTASESLCVSQLKKRFESKNYIKRLFIIKRDGTLIKYSIK